MCLTFVLAIAAILSAQVTSDSDLIESLIREGNRAEARKLLQEKYDLNDEDPQTNYWLAYLAVDDTLYDDAIDYLDVAIESDENNAEYYFLLGRAYAVKAQNSGGLTAAFAAPKIKSNWQKTIELDPNHIHAKWGLFQYYINAPGIVGGDDDEAKKLADDLSKTDPPRGHNMLAYYYAFVEEDYTKTDEQLEKSLSSKMDDDTKKIIVGSNTNLLNQLGYRCLSEEDYNNSHKYFKWAIKLSPEHENPYDSMGDHFAAVAQFDSALVYYKKALSIQPRNTVSRYNKGRMLEKLGDKEQAISTYQAIINDDPESSFADQAADRLDELEN
jgi:tetratricopeptide (TPR) repeat protein